MKQKILTILVLVYPLFSISQTNGISFESKLTWSEILSKAQIENKYIFLDCFTTWCGPCKQMDNSVYTNDSVGALVNLTCISVRLQMDSTKKDDENTKGRYLFAHQIGLQFGVNIFPTYLIFSPQGRILNRDYGAKSVRDFIEFINSSRDTTRQYYTLIERYRNGAKIYEKMPFMAKLAKQINQISLADSIAEDYIDNFILSQNDGELYRNENIKFILLFYSLLNSKGKAFQAIVSHSRKIDSSMNDNQLSNRIIDYVVRKEDVDPLIRGINQNKLDVNWSKLYSSIKRKYGDETAARNIRNAKPAFYKQRKDWRNYIKYLIEKIQNTPIMNGVPAIVMLNNCAYDIFERSNNKYQLRIALEWVDRASKMDSNEHSFLIDTKANLLYKLGRHNEALILEARAAEIAPNDSEIRTTINKMKNGEPTWPNL